MVVEFIAALRSLLIQLTTVETRIYIVIKVKAKPSFPLSGEIATMAKVAATVNIAPSKSGSSCFGVNFHGFCGVFAIKVWLILLLPSRFINNGIS